MIPERYTIEKWIGGDIDLKRSITCSVSPKAKDPSSTQEKFSTLKPIMVQLCSVASNCGQHEFEKRRTLLEKLCKFWALNKKVSLNLEIKKDDDIDQKIFDLKIPSPVIVVKDDEINLSNNKMNDNVDTKICLDDCISENEHNYPISLTKLSSSIKEPLICSSRGRPKGSNMTVIGLKRKNNSKSASKSKIKIDKSKLYSIIIADEIARKETQLWLDHDYPLTTRHRSIIKDGKWLSNNIINKCLDMMSKQFDHAIGLKNIDYFEDKVPYIDEDLPSEGLFVQIYLLSNHFVTVAGRFDRFNADLSIYDSMNSLFPNDKLLISKISSQFKNNNIPLSTRVLEVTNQGATGDCGVHAIANALSILLNTNPSSVRYDISMLRPHLINCLENAKFEMFPCLQLGLKPIYKGVKVKSALVYCSCRKPYGGHKTIQCDNCMEWFHFKCIKDSSNVDETWLCDYRCNKTVTTLD